MNITHVKVEGVGRFGTPTHLEGLGPGVNILSASNEAGKSTLFRAIRTCVFERHNTTREDVKRLATDGLTLPVAITLGFEHEGETYEITKNFLRSASATLSRAGTVLARNRDADERLWEILGIKPDTKLDPAAYGLLWVEQGQSFEVPEPSEGAASVLNSVIQQEVGTLVGGERARLVLKDIREELGKLVTEGGKPKAGGPYHAAQKHFESTELQRIEAETRLAELEANLEKLAGLRAEWKRINDKSETERLSRELSEAVRQLNEGEEAMKSLQRFVDDETQALKLRDAQKARLESLRLLAQRIDGNRNRIASLRADHQLLEREIAAAAVARDGALAEHKAIEARITELEARELVLQRLSGFSAKRSLRGEIARRLELLTALDQKLKASAAALQANAVDEAAITALATLERESEMLRIQSDAAASRLAVTFSEGVNVTVNGAPLDAATARAVTETLTIDVGGLATITVTPPHGSREQADAASAGLSRKLAALLDKHGAASAAELRMLRAERGRLEQTALELRSDRMALGIKDPAPAAEIARLDAQLRLIDTETARHLAGLDPDELPSTEETAAELAALHASRGELRTARERIAGVLDDQNGKLSGLGTSAAALAGEAKALEGQLAADLASLPDEQRRQEIAAAERDHEDKAADHRAKAQLLSDKRASVPTQDDIESRRIRADRLQQATTRRNAEIAALRDQIARLEGHVQSAGGDGLGERVAELQAESALARREIERHAERAAMLQLLRKVIEDAYDKRREELTAPLKRHLRPFLGDVFPRAEIEMGEGFAVSALRRSGPAGEVFDKLSRGTQEQIAVLVRLAMGAMIRDKGHDVPIILDDALVFSDDARIEQMFDAINRAGRNQQVIVLTCRARSFASLGGRNLRIV